MEDGPRTAMVPPGEDGESGPIASAMVTPALWETFNDWGIPEAREGQVWRLQWKDTVALAVVEPRRDRSTVSAIPLCEDPQFATDSDLILEPAETPFGMPFMAVVALEMVLHHRVLERCLGALADSALDDLRRLRNAFVHSQPPGLPIGRVGPPVTHELDERLQYRSEQREAHAPLIFADWYRAPRPGSSASELVGRTLAARSWTLDVLAKDSGVSVQTLLRIRRGEHPDVTNEEIASLARSLGVEATELEGALAERLPSEVRDALDLPRHKPRILAWGEKWHLDEDEARRRMGKKLVGTLRRAKQMSVNDWSILLEEQFPV